MFTDEDYPIRITGMFLGKKYYCSLSTSEGWEERFEKYFKQEPFYGLRKDEVESFLTHSLEKAMQKARKEERKETLEKIEIWLFDNGITHKSSFIQLKNFLEILSLKEKKELGEKDEN